MDVNPSHGADTVLSSRHKLWPRALILASRRSGSTRLRLNDKLDHDWSHGPSGAGASKIFGTSLQRITAGFFGAVDAFLAAANNMCAARHSEGIVSSSSEERSA